jgi:hypothetical protein
MYNAITIKAHSDQDLQISQRNKIKENMQEQKTVHCPDPNADLNCFLYMLFLLLLVLRVITPCGLVGSYQP